MQNCLDYMEKMPGLRAKVFNQIGQMANEYNEQKGQQGIEAGLKTRFQLSIKRKDRE